MSGNINVEMFNTRLFKHFNEMRNEVLKHKWIESEKACKDVGFEYALIDWIVKHKAQWDIERKPSNN